MGTVLNHCTVVACPGDISGRTTSGGAGEGECWSSGVQFRCPLKSYGGYHKVPCGRNVIFGMVYIEGFVVGEFLYISRA